VSIATKQEKNYEELVKQMTLIKSKLNDARKALDLGSVSSENSNLEQDESELDSHPS